MILGRRGIGRVIALTGLLLMVTGLIFDLAYGASFRTLPQNFGPAQIIMLILGFLLTVGGLYAAPRWLPESVRLDITAANILLLLISLTLTFSLVELVARFYLWNMTTEAQFNIYASTNQLRRYHGYDFLTAGQARYSPHQYLGYYPTPNYRNGEDRHNALGYRGEEIEIPKPDGIFRIVAMGGSTTYDSEVSDYTLSYPYLLEKELRNRGYSNIEVVNAGAAGYGTWETLINMAFRISDLDPDLILVYHAVNDVHTRLVWPPEVYRGDNSGFRGPFIQTIQMPPIWEYSTALRMIAIRAGWIAPHSALDGLSTYSPTNYLGEFNAQVVQDTYPQGIFLDIPAQQMIDENPPIYFERNLTEITALARANDWDIVLLSFAITDQLATPSIISAPEYVQAVDESNEIIRSVAETTGAHFFDFAAMMPLDEQYFADGYHFTFEGNQVRATLIADYLESLQILASP